MQDMFEKYIIKEYTYWVLYLHIQQYPYIGRCYADSKNASAKSVLDMSDVERRELFEDIIPQWHSAVETIWGKNTPNIAIFCNEYTHLHVHMIPRYEQSIQYMGEIFRDPNPGKNYAPYERKSLSSNYITALITQLQNTIS